MNESTRMFTDLRGPRFFLRKMNDHDIHAVFAGLSNPQVISHYGISYASLDATRVQMEWYATIEREGSGIWWAICDPESPSTLMGACGFNGKNPEHKTIEVGYWLLPEHWKKGVMSECLPMALKYAFEALAVHRVEAVVEPANVASVRVLEATGFRCEGIKRECEWKDGQPQSLLIYSRLATDI